MISVPGVLAASYEHCRRIAEGHYENFPVASLAVPRRLRPHFYALYAYCRRSDDLGDEGDPRGRLEALEAWDSAVSVALAGRETQAPILPAVAHTAAAFGIPRDLFHDLLRAFKQDQARTRYETEQDLIEYCRYSANPVGRMVLHLMGRANAETVKLSDSICTGLQLANFCQDVRVDWEKGRVYIPESDLREHGYTEASLADMIENEAFAAVMRRQVERAREWLRGGLPLSRRLGLRLGIEVRMITLGGLRILKKIEKSRYRVLSARPTLGKLDFTALLARALC